MSNQSRPGVASAPLDLSKEAVSEVYSPPRVAPCAPKYGMKQGISLDLTVNDPLDGMPWDFSREEKRQRARRLLKEQDPG